MNVIDWLSSLNKAVGGMVGLGVFVAGIGFAYAQFRAGSNKAKDDLIKTLQETVVVERDKSSRLSSERTTLINSHQEQITTLTSKVGKLQGLYESSESQKSEYIKILQGKSPDQEKFMMAMMESVRASQAVFVQAQDYMKTSSESLNMIIKLVKIREEGDT